MKILVSGASGFIGSRLVSLLASGGDELWTLVRRPPRPGTREVRYDPAAGTIDTAAMEGLDAVVHLGGRNMSEGRWTARRRDAFLRSRVESTALVAETLSHMQRRPGVLVSMSAVGFYGARGDEVLDESAAPGRGFLADVCRAWEAAALPAERAGIRVVHPRMGVVLSGRGGALPRMLLPFRVGLGGPVGGGGQFMSWIGIDDALRALQFCLAGPLAGPVNLTAPRPVTNAEFARTLGRVLRRPARVRVPGFVLRAALGQMADELLLTGARVAPARLLGAGFQFRSPELEPALRAALSERAP